MFPGKQPASFPDGKFKLSHGTLLITGEKQGEPGLGRPGAGSGSERQVDGRFFYFGTRVTAL